jgi:DNA-binding LacI/PurR family transcriptional regulator
MDTNSIAFLRGPQGQLEADQRFNAYKDELKTHDIRFEENLIIEGRLHSRKRAGSRPYPSG